MTKPTPSANIRASSILEAFLPTLRSFMTLFDACPGLKTHKPMMDIVCEMQERLAALADPGWTRPPGAGHHTIPMLPASTFRDR